MVIVIVVDVTDWDMMTSLMFAIVSHATTVNRTS